MRAIEGLEGVGYKQFADPRILEASRRAFMRQISAETMESSTPGGYRSTGAAQELNAARSGGSSSQNQRIDISSAAASARDSSVTGGSESSSGQEEAALSEATQNSRAARLRLENIRLRKWRGMLLYWDYFRGNNPGKIKSRCRKGIPDAVRAQAWSALLGLPPAGGAQAYIGGGQALYPRTAASSSTSDGLGAAVDAMAQAPRSHRIARPAARDPGQSQRASAPAGGSGAAAGQASAPEVDDGVSPLRISAQAASAPAAASSGASLAGAQAPPTRPAAGGRAGSSGAGTRASGLPSVPRHDPIRPDILANPESTPSYRVLLARGPCIGSEALSPSAVIDVDIARTYPAQPLFHASLGSASSHGQTALRNILRAYATLDPHVGYCQGMAFLAAMLLSYMPEERAFYAFVALMAQPPTRMAGMFTHDLGMVRVKQHQLRKGIEKCLPRVHAALLKHDVNESMWATHWVLTALSHSFPFAVVARLWDAFLSEGWKAVLRFCLAVLAVFAPEIEGSESFEELMGVLGTIPQVLKARLDNPEGLGGPERGSDRTQREPLTVDGLAQLAWSMPLVSRELAVWEKEGLEELAKQREKDKARQAAAEARRQARAAAKAQQKLDEEAKSKAEGGAPSS